MADQKLRFIAEWQDKGLKRGARDASKSMQSIKEGSADIQKGLLQATAMAGGFALALKKVYDITKQGAQLELAAIRFDRLATSIGTTGEALRTDLAGATQGLMTDAEQIALAGDLMSLGLAKTHDQAVRLTSVASQLGMNMNQLTLTLANQTTMRFDALGVSVDGFKEVLKETTEAGGDFTDAFLVQAENQIEKVGSILDTTAGQIQGYETYWKNLWETVKLAAVEGLAPALTFQNRLREAQQRGLITWAEQQTMMQQFARGDAPAVVEELDAIEEMSGRVAQGFQSRYIPAMEDAEVAMQGLNDQLDEVNQNIFKQGEAWAENREWVEAGGLAYQAEMTRIMSEVKDTDKAISMMNETTFEFVAGMAELENLSLSQIQEEFEKLGVDEQLAYNYALAIINATEKLDGMTATVDIFINTHGKVPKIGGVGASATTTTTTTLPTTNVEQLQQAGGNFIVPPQYTNDSFPMRVSAGERVRVDTASNTKQDALTARIAERRNMQYLADLIGQAIVRATV